MYILAELIKKCQSYEMFLKKGNHIAAALWSYFCFNTDRTEQNLF